MLFLLCFSAGERHRRAALHLRDGGDGGSGDRVGQRRIHLPREPHQQSRQREHYHSDA